VIDAIFSPEALAEIRAYKDPLYVARTAYDVSSLLVWGVILRFWVVPLFAWSGRMTARLDRRLGQLRTVPLVRVIPAALDRIWGGPGWGVALLFTMALELANNLAFLPLDVYFGYFHEQNFGMSTQSLSTYAWDYSKSVLIGMVPLAALAFGMLGLARRLPKWWLIIGAVGAVALVFSAAIDPYRSQVYFDRAPLPPGAVREAITELMRKANIDFKDVMVEKTLGKTVRVQAYFAGKGPTRVIVLNDALLKELEPPEILAVVGHEAGHVHERQWLGQLASTFSLLAFLYAIEVLFRLASKRGWWGIQARADVRTLPLVFFLFWIATWIISPISGAFSRTRELEADQFGIQLTGDVPAFRQMLIKVARVNKMDPDPPRWIVLKGWSHPPIRERLAAIH
jgi:STE24 endopeptidase